LLRKDKIFFFAFVIFLFLIFEADFISFSSLYYYSLYYYSSAVSGTSSFLGGLPQGRIIFYNFIVLHPYNKTHYLQRVLYLPPLN
jgi:hypothetical protein